MWQWKTFYSGLHKQYQPLVVHLKDKLYTTIVDLLKVIHMHEEAESSLQDQSYYSSYKQKYNGNGKNSPINGWGGLSKNVQKMSIIELSQLGQDWFNF